VNPNQPDAAAYVSNLLISKYWQSTPIQVGTYFVNTVLKHFSFLTFTIERSSRQIKHNQGTQSGFSNTVGNSPFDGLFFKEPMTFRQLLRRDLCTNSH
jgi:hypothetical protein